MENKSSDNLSAQMKKGILEYCILAIIARQEVYASDILTELKDANLLIVEGTLYPLLTRMKNNGYLTYNWVESNSGPPRKYFTITNTGRQFLHEIHTTWQELVITVNQITKK